jgi:hypothetical protein
MKKRELGQFYTTNAEYIIRDMINDIPDNTTIVDPFAGNWDLLNLFTQAKEAFDLDPKNANTQCRDSLINPVDYTGKYVITNPPYLAKNKTKNKAVFELYAVGDLYKAALMTFMSANGGIVIVPINFFSDEDNSVRLKFLSTFKIIHMHIFEEPVFDDTDYTVCAFSFVREPNNTQTITAVVFPKVENFKFIISANNGYRIGAEFYNTIKIASDIKIGRMVSFKKNTLLSTRLFLYAIDTGTSTGRIRLEYKSNVFYGISTDRAFATIGLSINLTDEQQQYIIKRFNELLEYYRGKFKSLFLTNYRNSTASYSRKRIGFDAAYGLILYIIEHELKGRKQL